ncbi:hypothetical protein CEXT_644391 [Caerostris extrusa]|uniref:C2H2-type domain-containing protein n=1 Tax=Caerostris extrusa TaxID=172846 RepID=A0AAV4UQE7_CAEEX|nr:hypothetical protein CEXT_644391 [Caerostris extrusa]
MQKQIGNFYLYRFDLRQIEHYPKFYKENYSSVEEATSTSSSTEKSGKKWQCYLCPYVTDDNSEYHEHLMGHIEGKTFQCPVLFIKEESSTVAKICPYTTPYKCNLKRFTN